MHHNHYLHLGIMTLLSFIAMYILMYAMVDVTDSVYHNLNQVYMAGLMAAPMAIIELLVMQSMYQNKKANIAIMAISAVALIGFFLMIRQQTAIGDQQFLRSMIPHHAGAILMCEKATLQRPEIQTLCQQIIKGQREEIAQMKALLAK